MRNIDVVLAAAGMWLAAACSTPATTTDAADVQTADVAADDAQTADALADVAADVLSDVAGADTAADVAPDVAPDAAADVPPVDDTAAPDVAPDATAPDVADDVQTPDAGGGNLCKAYNGVCVSDAASCTKGKGTLAPGGNSGCVFSDGPGACCVPPPMTDSSAACSDFGGVCAPIAGCNFADGSFAPPSCGYPGFVCCVPQHVCGPETMSCCNDMTTFRPACDHGKYICTIEGTTMKPTADCPK